MKRARIRDQVKRLQLGKRTDKPAVMVELRIVRTENTDVPWAITGLIDGNQHTETREPCQDALEIIGYVSETLLHLDREVKKL